MDSPAILQHPQAVYAAWYGTTARNIRMWLQRGLAAGKPAPLDSPEAMGAWWLSVYKKAIPGSIRYAAARRRKYEEGAIEALQVAAEPAELAEVRKDEPSATSLAEKSSAEKIASNSKVAVVDLNDSMDTVMANARKIQQSAAEAYERALREGVDIDRADRRWQNAVDMLVKLEKTLPVFLKNRRELLPAGEVSREIQRINAGLKTRFERFARNILPRLRGLGENEANALYDAELQSLFAEFDGELMNGAPRAEGADG